MGSIARQEGVLKLIHPGGYIETHRKPIMASQVMARNPRHYVTRPDVFKFPYIVVSPDSVLRPGDVFFIVPWKTLHRLVNSATNTASSAPTPTPAPAPAPVPNPAPQQVRPMRPTRAYTDDNQGYRPTFAPTRQVVPKKSCLKKEGSSSRGHKRVRFYLPAEGCCSCCRESCSDSSLGSAARSWMIRNRRRNPRCSGHDLLVRLK